MAIDLFKEYATDEKLEVEGVWHDLGDDTRLKLARANNKAYNKMLGSLYEKNKRLLDMKNEAAEAKSEQILIDVLAKTILLDWENVVFKGEALPYSLENAKMLLEIKDFRKQVMLLADDTDKFKAENEEAAEKKLIEYFKWDITWGPQLKSLLEIQETMGIVPQALENRPETTPHIRFMVEAFFDLTGDRPLGMSGAGSIPSTSIFKYADELKIRDADERFRFLRLIRLMDNAYLEAADKSAKQSSNK